jgi:hypothetical protein
MGPIRSWSTPIGGILGPENALVREDNLRRNPPPRLFFDHLGLEGVAGNCVGIQARVGEQ